MVRLLLIPMCLLAGVGIFLLSRPSVPAVEPQQFISSTTPGIAAAQAYLLPISEPSYVPIRDTTVGDPDLDANVAMAYHVDDGSYLYEKNTSIRVPIASLTKIASALVVQDLFDSAEVVTVASGSIRVDGQKQTLYQDERISVQSLLSMMLVESSNDAAYALAAYAKERGIDFVAKMNEKALSLGMHDCTFTDPAGLDDQATCTARDLVKLVRATLRQAPHLWPIMATQELTVTSVDQRISHVVKSTDDLLGQISGIVGGKTGYTDGALGCLIMVVKLPGERDTLISIVLGSRSRFADTSALIAWAQRAYRFQ